MADDSIEHIVAERLDRIFGDDDEDDGIRQAPAGPPKSAIEPLRKAALELKSSFLPENVGRLTSSINSLQKSRGNDPLFLPLLKMMQVLSGHLSTAKRDTSRAALQSVNSIIECMEALETGHALPDAEKRKRVQKEIESFKTFREAIRSSRPPEPIPVATDKTVPATAVQPPAYTPSAGEKTAPPVTETPAATADAGTVPPQPEPEVLKADTSAPIARSQDLVAFREEISALKDRIDGIMKTLEVKSVSGTELQNTVSQIGKQVDALSSLPGAIRILLKKAMEKPPGKTEDPSVKPLKLEDVRSCVVEAVKEGLNAGLKDLREMPSGLREVHDAVLESINRLDNRINELHHEIRSVQEGLGSIRLELDSLQHDEAREETLEKEALETDMQAFSVSAEDEEVPGRFRETEYAGTGGAEPADAIEKPAFPARPGLPTGSYFLFSVGGKKYAVDERHVVKVSPAGAGLVKKAGIRGGLTISDSSSGLFNTKKGIEPAWRTITSGEIKQTLFRLVPEGALDGLEDTNGEGAIFLGVGDERILLFTDQPAEKITLGREDEVQMSGVSGTRAGAVCGSIQRSGERSGFYLILSPEKIR